MPIGQAALKFCLPWASLRVRSFGVIWIRISDPRSVWIMVHQKNRWIHDQSGFTGSTDTPWSTQILDHWSWFRSPQRRAPCWHFSIKFAGDLYDLLPIGQVRAKLLLTWRWFRGTKQHSFQALIFIHYTKCRENLKYRESKFLGNIYKSTFFQFRHFHE